MMRVSRCCTRCHHGGGTRDLAFEKVGCGCRGCAFWSRSRSSLLCRLDDYRFGWRRLDRYRLASRLSRGLHRRLDWCSGFLGQRLGGWLCWRCLDSMFADRGFFSRCGFGCGCFHCYLFYCSFLGDGLLGRDRLLGQNDFFWLRFGDGFLDSNLSCRLFGSYRFGRRLFYNRFLDWLGSMGFLCGCLGGALHGCSLFGNCFRPAAFDIMRLRRNLSFLRLRGICTTRCLCHIPSPFRP